MADVLGQERSQLVITLKDAHGETFNFNISNPKHDITEQEIKAIAEHIVTHNYFKSTKGSDFVAFVKARVVSFDTDRYDLTV